MNILIIDEMHLSILDLFGERGWRCFYAPCLSKEEVLNQIKFYDVLILRSKINIDQYFLAHAPRLQCIVRAGAGLDQIDVAAVQQRNIHLMNAPEGNRDAVGEHTLALLLCLMTKLHLSDREVRKGIWNREGNRGFELLGKTVSIIGYGNMGKAFAKRLTGFDCKVLAYDKYKKNYGNPHAHESDMENIFEQTDILSLHVPLTDETRNMLNINYLQQFRKNIWLINTARGEIVPLQDLLEALQTGKVIGAGLDVLENEKLQQLSHQQQHCFDKLAQLPQVVFSPHVGGWTHESYHRINEVIVSKLAAWQAATGLITE